MASHVVVLDASARRQTIKTTPQKYLVDVKNEACTKFGLDPDLYGLKVNDKPVDLSRTINLAGLSPGAKLSLVQASRSAVPVSVALVLPESASSTPNTRLIDKFPSTTSLWQILRRFESGVAGSEGTAGKNFNFTQRASPLMANGADAAGGGMSGAGRLCYEMPTLNLMGRQLESVSDLSKTLQQLGVKGSVMMRLGFKNTMKPLEEAMAEISNYFDHDEEKAPASQSALAPAPDTMDASGEVPPTTSTPQPLGETQETFGTEPMSRPEVDTTSNPSSIPSLSVFAPPSASTPAAAESNTPHNEADYIPTAEHARSHQANLSRSSRNKKLLGESEIQKQREEREADLAKVSSVTVRLRFPDQSSVQKDFGQEDTLASLYETCRAVLERTSNEQFELHATKAGGTAVQGGGTGAITSLPESNERLIKDLGWTGRVLVTVGWGPKVAKERRAQSSLKPEFRARAEELKVEQPKEDMRGTGKSLGDATPMGAEGETAEASKQKKTGDKEARLKKLLGFKK